MSNLKVLVNFGPNVTNIYLSLVLHEESSRNDLLTIFGTFKLRFTSRKVESLKTKECSKLFFYLKKCNLKKIAALFYRKRKLPKLFIS